MGSVGVAALCGAMAMAIGGCVVSVQARGGGGYVRTPSGSAPVGSATLGAGIDYLDATATVESDGDGVAVLGGAELNLPGKEATDDLRFGFRVGVAAGKDYDGGRAVVTGGVSYPFLIRRRSRVEEHEYVDERIERVHVLSIGLDLMLGGRFSSDDDGLIAGVGLMLEYQWLEKSFPDL